VDFVSVEQEARLPLIPLLLLEAQGERRFKALRQLVDVAEVEQYLLHRIRLSQSLKQVEMARQLEALMAGRPLTM
jgi:hypothetical protein